MSSNSIGKIFTLTTFGESHGAAMGGVIDGCPAGLEIDVDFIQQELNRRKPGQSHIVTQRKEDDVVEFLSGIYENKTLGTPIGFIIKNTNQRSSDYGHLEKGYRPSHADYTYDMKYGHRDHRGGGRASIRDSVSWVVAGAIAKLFLKKYSVKVNAFTSQVGDIKLLKNYKELDLNKIDSNIVRCPDALIAETMISKIEQIRKEGDTIGGVVSCVVTGVSVGLGEPVFEKLQANLAKTMLTINAAKGFEYGSGFEGVKMKGSEHNDALAPLSYGEGQGVRSLTNHSGGIQGGITNGEDIYFRVAFKPVSTIMKNQKSVDDKGNEVELQGKGRHDPCVVPRAVPIVEALTSCVLMDNILMNKLSKI